MHACLGVDEIVRLIAYELVYSSANATTVALARCRRSFEDPVLDVLWETRGGLLHLLKSLPGDVWNEGRYTVSAPTIYLSLSLNSLIRKAFTRLPTTLEWTRFRKYALRMRNLGASDGLDVPSPAVFSILQLCAITKPLFPNIEIISLLSVGTSFPFIPLFLSPRTTTINITFTGSGFSKATAALAIAAFPTLCPNLQNIALYTLQDPMITTAVSGMLLASNRNTLRSVVVDSPLTEEARDVVYTLPNLCRLWVVIERATSVPSAVLPNLTRLIIIRRHESDWLLFFRGATLGRLEAVAFHSDSGQIGDFLQAFKKAALAISIQNTLSKFHLQTSCSGTQTIPPSTHSHKLHP